MARTVFTNELVFDGSGSAPVPGDIVVEGDQVVEVRAGWHPGHQEDRIIDATGCTVMPGLVESHAHPTFPPAPGIIYAKCPRGRGVRRQPRGRGEAGFGRGPGGMAAVYPEIRKRGIRALSGGGYGFPNNPIGRNARDLDIGMLRPGWVADVLVVRGNPAGDVRVLQQQDNLVAIMQAGRFHKAPAA